MHVDPLLALDLVAASPEGIVLFDDERRVRFANEAAASLIGCRPEDLIGSRLDDHVLPERAQTLDDGMDAMRRAGRREGSAELIRVDGTRVHADYRGITAIRPGVHLITLRDVTGRAALEQALRDAETQARILAEHASDVVASGTADGLLTWVSPSVRDALGHDPADLVGRRFIDLVHPGDRPAVRTAQAGIARGLPCGFEARVRTAAGAERWFRIRVQPIHDASGAIAGGVSGWQAIDAEIAARDALEASERLYRSTLESLAEGVVVQGMSGAITFANGAAQRILGITVDELTGVTSMDDRWEASRPDGTPLPGEDHPSMVTLRTGVPQRAVRMAIAHPDGRRILLRINTDPLRDRSGAVAGVVASFEDVTAEMRAQAVIERGRIELAEAQRIAGVGSWRLDVTTGRIEWSEELYRIWGLDPADRPPTLAEQDAFVDPGIAADRNAAIARTIREGVPYELEYDIQRRDGTRRRLDVRGEAIRDASGRIVGLRGTTSDVTDARAELAARARQVAHRADYNARVEHVLRTKLSVVEGWAELLLARGVELGEAARADALAAMGRNAHELGSLLGAMMSAAAAETRAEAHAVGPVDVAQLATVVVADYAGLETARSVTAEPASGVVAMGTREAFDTVIRHLVENALRHGGPSVAVVVACDRPAPDRVRIAVRDDGPGFPAGTDPFAAFASHGAGKGHGLGLHVVRTVVEGLGGEVVARARADGPGAEVVVTVRGA